MNDRNPRFTLTGTHFVQSRPIRTGTEPAPTNPIPEGRAYIKRMSWSINPGMRTTAPAAAIAAAIRDTALPDAAFFPDTCFLTTPLDVDVWQSLLTRKLVLTPLIHQELRSWLDTPRYNVAHCQELKNRLAANDAHIELVRGAEAYREHGYEYYCPLLLLRKLKGYQFGSEFEVKEGRPPTRDEFQRGYKKVGPGYDDRAARMGWKGYTDYEKPNYAADEQLVTMAVLHALMTGRETTILTRDHDIMEQLYKLVFLIDTHYRGMLFAERYAAASGAYESRSKRVVVEGRPDFADDRFEGDDDLFVRPNLPSDTLWNDLLPPPGRWVNVGCAWFGGGPDEYQVAQLVFCADADMARVLRIKAATGGLNTDLLDGRNCHIWPHPALAQALGPCVAVARDRMVNYHPNLPPFRALDMIHAVVSGEGFDRFEIEGADPGFPFPPAEQ